MLHHILSRDFIFYNSKIGKIVQIDIFINLIKLRISFVNYKHLLLSFNFQNAEVLYSYNSVCSKTFFDLYGENFCIVYPLRIKAIY